MAQVALNSLRTIDRGFIDKHVDGMARIVEGIDAQIQDKQDIIDSLQKDIENLRLVRQGYRVSMEKIRADI